MTKRHDKTTPGKTSGGDSLENGDAKIDQDVIELSDIVVGMTQDDDLVVERTEGIIDEAFFGFSQATSEKIHEDQSEMDLSQASPSDDLAAPSNEEGVSAGGHEGSQDAGLEGGPESSDDDIGRKLDYYFGSEDSAPKKYHDDADMKTPVGSDGSSQSPGEGRQDMEEGRVPVDIPLSARRLDDALERVIRKLYAEKINRIMDLMIERTVTDEIGQLKDYLIGVAGGKNASI